MSVSVWPSHQSGLFEKAEPNNRRDGGEKGRGNVQVYLSAQHAEGYTRALRPTIITGFRRKGPGPGGGPKPEAGNQEN